jgi:hypothetical protein
MMKMSRLKGEDGYIFNNEERVFLEYLINNKRVCFFKQAKKEDEGKMLKVKEENLLKLIKDTNYIRNKKINHIISEGAKLSIREFVDYLSNEAEPKVQKLCSLLVRDFLYRSHKSI